MSKRITAPKRQVRGHTFRNLFSLVASVQQSFNIMVSPEQREILIRIVGNITVRATVSGFASMALVYLREGTAAQALSLLIGANPLYLNRLEDVLAIWDVSASDGEIYTLAFDVKAMRKMRLNDVIQVIAVSSATGITPGIVGKMFTKLA